MKAIALLFAFALVVLVAACAPVVDAASPGDVTPKATEDCQAICKGAGLEMTSLVVIRSSLGCVCEPKRTQGTSGGVGAASGGAVAVLLAQQAQQQQQQRRK